MKGWLDKYQEGGNVAVSDATRTKFTKNTGLKKGVDQPVSNMLDITLGAPQRQLVKMITGKEQSPSEAMEINNPYGAFAADAILDPTILVGAGLLGKAAKASTKTGILSNAYKINPFAFKPTEGMMYRGIGEAGMADALKSGVFRQAGFDLGIPKYNQVWYAEGPQRFAKAQYFSKDIIAEVPKSSFTQASMDKVIGAPGSGLRGTNQHIPITEGKILKKDWLQGYKPVEIPKKENGGWLEKYNDGGPIQPNYNDSNASAGPGFQGDGYSNVGRNYSPAWGGQFAMGGALPGATGSMYARIGAPSKGKDRNKLYKTDASAQNGTEMKYYQEGLDWKPKSISRDGDNVAYTDNTRVGNVSKYTRPSNYQGNQPDTLGENIFEVLDPSGVSSWDDIYRSYNKTGMSDQTTMEAFGAIPMLGKLKKAGQFLDIIGKAIPKTGRQARNLKASVNTIKAVGKYGPNAGRATDAIQAYTQRNEYEQGGHLTKLDQLTNFTNYNTKQPGGWLDKYQ